MAWEKKRKKKKTCSEEYVGETLRTVSVLRKEHSDAIHLVHGSKSAIAEHVHNQSSSSVEFVRYRSSI